ncbi:hypothetical protein TNCV_4558851 [Trichonephila clavipes]|nr:hypothetical protein TNCV_4558851 [Trichonephila clavipes]
MLKSRTRKCGPSKGFEGRLEIIECLNKFLPTLSDLVSSPLNNKYRIGRVAWPPPHSLLISIETKSGFISEAHTSSVSHSPAFTRLEVFQSTLPMMWGQW